MSTLDRLHAWVTAQPSLRVFTIAVRVLLTVAFVPSGLVKILGQPFTTLPETDPVGYFFAGFFSAHGYYRFIGVAQWAAAACLIVPRTATIGALLYLPIIINIFAITLAIGPAFAFTRVIAGGMLAANLYLLFWDWDRWRLVLPVRGPMSSRHGTLLTTLGLLAAGVLGLQGVTGLHLARLRGDSYPASMAMVAVAGLVGLSVLVAAYRQAAATRPGRRFFKDSASPKGASTS